LRELRQLAWFSVFNGASSVRPAQELLGEKSTSRNQQSGLAGGTEKPLQSERPAGPFKVLAWLQPAPLRLFSGGLAMFKNPHKNDFAALVLRLGLAAIFLLDGYFKVAQHGGATWHPALPHEDQLLVAWGEVFGGIALVLGFWTRLSAAGLGIIMVAAVALVSGGQELVHIRPYLLNGAGVAQITGFEYLLNFALAMMCLALVIQGGGQFALDYCLVRGVKRIGLFIRPAKRCTLSGV
jgi:putative oxidoreductase